MNIERYSCISYIIKNKLASKALYLFSVGCQVHISQCCEVEPVSARGVGHDRPLSAQWVLIATLESCH